MLAHSLSSVTRAQDLVRLRDLLKVQSQQGALHRLRDEGRPQTLWDYRHSGYAERFWKQRYDRAMRSRIEPPKAFARNLKGYLPGILSHCRWPLGTNLVEGINNKIKVIKRRAYGFRDDDYFFLKFRAAFPGDRR